MLNKGPWVRENILRKRNYMAKCQLLIEYGLFKNQSRGVLLSLTSYGDALGWARVRLEEIWQNFVRV